MLIPNREVENRESDGGMMHLDIVPVRGQKNRLSLRSDTLPRFVEKTFTFQLLMVYVVSNGNRRRNDEGY